MSRIIQDVVVLLNRLIQLDYDATEASKAALAFFVDPRDTQHLATSLADHRRHIDDLAIVVRNLGGAPAANGNRRQMATRGKVVIGGLTGDRAILEAMRSNEEATRAAYEDAASLPGVPVDVLAVLERNLSDERAHLAEIVQRLNALRPPIPSVP
jgi:uncharacterized protein (TIGR02284 family)